MGAYWASWRLSTIDPTTDRKPQQPARVKIHLRLVRGLVLTGRHTLKNHIVMLHGAGENFTRDTCGKMFLDSLEDVRPGGPTEAAHEDESRGDAEETVASSRPP